MAGNRHRDITCIKFIHSGSVKSMDYCDQIGHNCDILDRYACKSMLSFIVTSLDCISDINSLLLQGSRVTVSKPATSHFQQLKFIPDLRLCGVCTFSLWPCGSPLGTTASSHIPKQMRVCRLIAYRQAIQSLESEWGCEIKRLGSISMSLPLYDFRSQMLLPWRQFYFKSL